MADLDARRRDLKEAFISSRGHWSPSWDGLLELDPDFFESFAAFSGVPWQKGVLEPKFKELVYLTISASTTHLYEPSVRIHIRNSLSLGATTEEILEVFELISAIGIHACTMGVPVLLDELRAAGVGVDTDRLDERQRELKESFISRRGYWSPFWDGLLWLDADFFEAYLDFSGLPWQNGVLEPKLKELIYVAMDASTTHLYEPGLRVHMRNALSHGATKEEVLEVLELVGTVGIHTCVAGIPLLLDELRRNGTTAVQASP